MVIKTAFEHIPVAPNKSLPEETKQGVSSGDETDRIEFTAVLMTRTTDSEVNEPNNSEYREKFPDLKSTQLQTHVAGREEIRGDIGVTNKSESLWRVRFQETLYARDHEQSMLRKAFESSRRLSNELIIIHGCSGVGKSRLARTLRPLVGNGYFILGKFDQLRRPGPYTAFVDAFTDLTHQIKWQNSDRQREIRDAIEKSVGTEKSVLTGMIPALEEILGSPDHGPRANTGGALQRFVFVFRMFIRSLCSPEQPLVLVLDDIQFADMCSLDLLHSIASDHKNEGLVIVATCDDSIQPDSYLASRLRDLEDGMNVKITNIPLSSFTEVQVQQTLQDALLMNDEDSESLATTIHKQTEGNVFYVIEYLRWIQDRKILRWDNSLCRWRVGEENEVEDGSNGCKASSDFLLNTIKKLPVQSQEVLKVSACLGPSIDMKLVSAVLEFEFDGILEDLRCRGLLWRSCSSLTYEFDHDVVQNAAYKLIPNDEKELFHLEIGRRMWRKLSSDEVDKCIFVVLSQMIIGRSLITREQEQIAVATLCLHAGKKAARASTFRVAAIYLDFGLMLMDDKRWRTDYDVVLSLYLASAEMEMCRANFDAMNHRIDAVLERAMSFQDKHRAFMTKIYALSSQSRSCEAIELGLRVLEGLGEGVTKNLSRTNLYIKYRSAVRILRGKTNEQLLRMKMMTDESKLHALQTLNMMMLPAFLERPDLAPFLTLKSMKISLRCGLSIFASSVFAVYGMFCVAAGAGTRESERFAKLSLVLLERFQEPVYAPRVYAALYGCVLVWSRPVRETLGPLLKANQIGAQTGDFEFAGLCANQWCWNAFETGVPLDEIRKRWQGFHENLTMNKQDTLLRMAAASMQNVMTLMGLSLDSLPTTAQSFDYDKMLDEAFKTGELGMLISIKVCRMEINFLFGNFDKAYRQRTTLDDIGLMPPSLERVGSTFYLGLLCIEMARQRKVSIQNMWTFSTCLRRLRRWSLSCPQNFVDKVFLMEAELESFRGNHAKASEKYTCAVGMARANNSPNLAGIASERFGWHLHRIGSTADAKMHWSKAKQFYETWQAHALARRIDGILQEIS